jgi:methionyl-tRNA formyltransferase
LCQKPIGVPNVKNQIRQAVWILFDQSNDWLSKYFPLNDHKDISKFDVRYTNQVSDVTEGSIVFAVGNTRILSTEFLDRMKAVLVVHESALPLGKGFAPVQWQILYGKKVIPVCLIEATANVDSGEVFGRTEFSLNGSELYQEIRSLQADATKFLISEYLNGFPNVYGRPQVGEESFFQKRTPADSKIDPNRSITDQFDLLRIANNEEWPAFFDHLGCTYILKIEKKVCKT